MVRFSCYTIIGKVVNTGKHDFDFKYASGNY